MKSSLKNKDMKAIIIAIIAVFMLMGGLCFGQSGNEGMKPPNIQERLKIVDEKICQPLLLDKTQKEKVLYAFYDFFLEMDKMMDPNANPAAPPDKSKVDPLVKIRDEKVKMAIPANLNNKYQELEKTTRPQGPPPGMQGPK
jgi:hypothetical protein